MEISLFDAAIKGFLNLLHLKVFLAMLVGVSIGTFTAVAPQGLGMPLVYAIALPIVIKWPRSLLFLPCAAGLGPNRKLRLL
jgi:TctA family transporter